MNQILFSSTQVYRTAPTIGGIILIGSVLFYKEQDILVLFFQYLLLAVIFVCMKNLREFFKTKKNSLRRVVVILILSLVGQVFVAFFLSDAPKNLFLGISFVHGISIGLFFFFIFNPTTLSKMGWIDSDSKHS